MASDNMLGFTCVENQILMLMREYGQPEKYLYFDSAVPLKDLYNYIVTGNVPFYRFKMIDRIQDVLKRLGIIEMTLSVEAKPLATEGHILIRVKPEFVTGKLHRRSIREDHFVRIKKHTVINDIPNTEMTLTEEELNEAYDGRMFKIKYLRDITDSDIHTLHKNRRYKIEDGSVPEFKDINMDRIVDLLVVYKILRQRMKEYYSADFIDGYLDEIEKLRMKSQYSVLRKDEKGINEVLDALKEIDAGIWGSFNG